MVDFGGWDMPVNYGSQIEEHHAVRRAAGVFDVSHMGVIDVRGATAGEFLRGLLANDVARLRQPGKALYSCMLREDAGILDDLIVYMLDPRWYRVVVNAGTRNSDLAWMRAQAERFDIELQERRELAMAWRCRGPARARTWPRSLHRPMRARPSPCRNLSARSSASGSLRGPGTRARTDLK